MTAIDALGRTLLLMRTDLQHEVTNQALLDALLSTRVLVVGDTENLSSPEGQHALVTSAALIARSGGKCLIEAPNVTLLGAHPPLRKPKLVDALLDLGRDLVPGQEIAAGVPTADADMAIVLGDTPYSGGAPHVLRLSGGGWRGRIGPRGERWSPDGSPFGALAAAGLAACEVYKLAMRRLRAYAASDLFEDLFRPTVCADVALAPPRAGLPVSALGRFDLVSGGAIAHAALYALARILGATGEIRVIEPDTYDVSNINRYGLFRRSDTGVTKAIHLAGLDLGKLTVQGIPLRYEASQLEAIGPLCSHVLVGVDHVASRWAVQEARPVWLGIGATEDYSAVVSVHTGELPCAHCVHSDGGIALRGPIPTAAFVSHWAGLWLAATFARRRSGCDVSAGEQVTYLPSLQLG